MSGGCLESVWRVSRGCLEDVWKVSGRCLEEVWMVSERSLASYGGCLHFLMKKIKSGQITVIKVFLPIFSSSIWKLKSGHVRIFRSESSSRTRKGGN